MVSIVLSLVAQKEVQHHKMVVQAPQSSGVGYLFNLSLFGYKGHYWEVDKDEADVERTIYNFYLVEHFSTQIACLLARSGILTVKGIST